jgi:hypothetical protein
LLVVNLIDERPALHREVGGVGIIRPIAHRPQALCLDQFHPERIGESRDDVELQLPEIGALPLKPVSPQMRAGFGRDELGVDRDLLAGPPHAPFEHIANAKLLADFLGVEVLALVGEGRAAGDNEAVGQMREVGRQIIGDSVGEIFLLRIAAEIGEWQNHD